MLRRVLTIVSVLHICFMCLRAQDTFVLKGRVIDLHTRDGLPGATVQLMTSDSVVIGQQTPKDRWVRDDRDGYNSDFSFMIPRQEAVYILKSTCPGYKPACVTYVVGDIKRREFAREVPPIVMREAPVMMREVSVTASKVKFYNRGDTVIYNADAFVLAEGTMLDALVRQLPGLEINTDGHIFHNGRFVESLQVNGNGLFNGDNDVVLDNLPSYTVQRVEVYDSYGKLSDLLDEKQESNKQYVMNVWLKKEYGIGTSANAEGGYGTENRWLARVFAMRYTDRSRLAFYGNTNNLNDSRKPGQDNDWTPELMKLGESRDRMAGLDYAVNDGKGRNEASGTVLVSHTDQNLTTDQDRVNFLPQGDTYDYSRSVARNRSLSLSTTHSIDLTRKNGFLHLEPTFSYSSYERSNSSVSATFSAMQYDVSRSLLENIFSLNAQDTIRRALINRYKKETLSKGYSLNGGLTATGTMKFNGNNDYLDIEAELAGGSQKDDEFNRYAIRYGSDGNGTGGNVASQAYQYFKNHPDRRLTYRAFAAYHLRISRAAEFSIGYGYTHRHSEKNSSLYLLDTLSSAAIGVLPSVEEYASRMDRRNSYVGTKSDGTHDIRPGMSWTKDYERGKLYFEAGISIMPARRQLDYRRGDTDTTIVRNTVKWALPRWLLSWTDKKRSFTSQLALDVQTTTPDLVNMVNIIDDTDPMNIRIGNPNLRNQQTYELSGFIRKGNHRRQTMKSLRLEYRRTVNALAMGYSYDSATGVHTYRADNVDGNWLASATAGYDTPLDRPRRLMLYTGTRAECRNSVDLIGESETGKDFAPVKSTVRTTHLGENLRLNYKVRNFSTLALKCNFVWKRSTSKRTDFTDINAFNFDYGAIAAFRLPWHIQLATDLTMYSRRGYEGSSMNTDNLIWNARISYAMLQGRLTWMLDGLDLLGQLDNVTRTVNAQGRTETYINVLPRYALLHLVYRFSKLPKKNNR